MTSPTPKGLFTFICQTPSEAGSFSSELNTYAGSPLHSYEALSGRSLSSPSIIGLCQLSGCLWHTGHGSVFSFPAVKTHGVGSPWSQSWALRYGWIYLDCCSSCNCLLEPTVSPRSHKSHLPWGSLQLVFPSSAGHRPSPQYLLLKLTIHSLYLIIQQNLSSTWVVLGRVEAYFG